MTSRNVPLYLFRPLNQTLSPCIVGCSHTSRTNVLALVNVPIWETTSLTRGYLERILGECGDFKAEADALFYRYAKPGWPPGITVSIPNRPTDRHIIQGRSFNIDPEGCQDIDDVFTIGDDGYFYITISDVAEWMKENPESLRKAQQLGQTQYSIDGQILQPMLPFQKECSLLPNTLRMGVSLRCKPNGSDISFQKTMITNNTSYTYETIYKAPVLDTFKQIVHSLGCRSEDSHEWVEHLMIFYNIEAAKVLHQTGKGILRVHSAPDIQKLETYKHLGVDGRFLAFHAASYVPTTTKETHWGLNADLYCHATSPIRRFSDVINQYVLKQEEPPNVDIPILNDRAKELKQFARDSFFLRQLQTTERSVTAIVLNDHRIWVPSWKRRITCKNTCKEGSEGTLYFSLDMNQPTWKRRMVFRFGDTANPA